MEQRESRRATVAVIGDGVVLDESDERVALAEAVGRGIVDAGHRLITGGRGGVMAAACRGARQSPSWTDGRIVGILPGTTTEDANPWVDIAIPTALGHGRNQIVAMADAVIAIGGGAGTLSEIAFAWMHHRLVIAIRCGGWSEQLADERVDGRVRLPDTPEDRVYGAADASEALQWLEELLPLYRRS